MFPLSKFVHKFRKFVLVLKNVLLFKKLFTNSNNVWEVRKGLCLGKNVHNFKKSTQYSKNDPDYKKHKFKIFYFPNLFGNSKKNRGIL